MQFHFDNITISGGVAVGKSTLIDNLKPYLEPYNWKFKSVGDIFRDYVKEHVAPNASLVPDDFDRAMEKEVERKLTEEKHWIIQAWISGFVARKLPHTLRVLLICKDNSLRVDRVANRDKITVEQAKHFIKEREQDNISKYKRLYGDYNFWDPTYYHLVIDTYSSGQLETTGMVLDKLGYDISKIEVEKKLPA
jgi:cytidylate kinase